MSHTYCSCQLHTFSLYFFCSIEAPAHKFTVVDLLMSRIFRIRLLFGLTVATFSWPFVEVEGLMFRMIHVTVYTLFRGHFCFQDGVSILPATYHDLILCNSGISCRP